MRTSQLIDSLEEMVKMKGDGEVKVRLYYKGQILDLPLSFVTCQAKVEGEVYLGVSRLEKPPFGENHEVAKEYERSVRADEREKVLASEIATFLARKEVIYHLTNSPGEALGTEEGDTCHRDGCQGVLELAYDESLGGCSCFIDPPCSRCTSSYVSCPVCHWREEEE